MATVQFKNVDKIYDNNVQAVFDFTLDVADKEFIVLVGPSGCGKSTTLRMLAGLEDITSGTISIDGNVVNDVLPKNRDIAMVFQNYALYPHMTVYANMAFALRMKHLSKEEIDERVTRAAEILALTPYLKRKPKALSGGQRQRVALGRAIVRTPKVFLMDEPLSNLDAKLRVQMRSEIIRIHKNVGATTIYVTHDQTEAMTMADRIVIMKDGYVQQIGTPKEVYNFPANTFVGGFIGSPAMNFVNVVYRDGTLRIQSEDGNGMELPFASEHKDLIEAYGKAKIDDIREMLSKIPEAEEKTKAMLDEKATKQKKADIEAHLEKLAKMKIHYERELEEFNGGVYTLLLGIRPEDLFVSKEESDGLPLSVDLAELLGHETVVYAFLGKQKLIIKTSSKHDYVEGEPIWVSPDLEKVHFFDIDTGKRIAF